MWSMCQEQGHSSPLPPHAGLGLGALPPHFHPHALWASLLVPLDCVHLLPYLHLIKTYSFSLCTYMCVGALRLHGDGVFHSCPHTCTEGCTRLLFYHISHVCMHSHTKLGLCFSPSCKSLHTNACFLLSCTKGQISLCVYSKLVQMRFPAFLRNCAVQLYCLYLLVHIHCPAKYP